MIGHYKQTLLAIPLLIRKFEHLLALLPPPLVFSISNLNDVFKAPESRDEAKNRSKHRLHVCPHPHPHHPHHQSLQAAIHPIPT